MAIDVAPTPSLTLWQQMELAEMLQSAHRQALSGYRLDRSHAREVETAESGDVADLADLAEVERERDALLEASEVELELLREIEDAMDRMRDGSYGLCLEGGEPIPFARLRAVPWARCCSEHQATIEGEIARRSRGR
jgi:RNA polymerase-binding protein DksA